MAQQAPDPSEQMINIPNLGGITKIEITDFRNVTLSYPNSKNEVSVINEQAWFELPIIQESASLQETSKNVEEGIVYELKLEFLCPAVSQHHHIMANKYINKGACIIVHTANGSRIIIGTPIIPAYLNLTKDIPKKVKGLNCYRYSSKSRNTHPMRFVA